MGTGDNIFLHGLITHLINQGKTIYCAFVDFSKAFDYTNGDILCDKLFQFGVRDKLFKFIQSIYANVKLRVKYGTELISEFECYLGVRQRESLSPFLFSLYLNDIENRFYNSRITGIDIGNVKLFLLLYTDDITIFSETPEGLQEGLNLLRKYNQKWKLTVNTEKSKVIVFRKGVILPRQLKFYYGTMQLQIISSFPYLGVVFTAEGSFSNAHNTLSGQAKTQ